MLKKRQQELEAAERALADADSRLATARQDFESSTARRRLNAFIRAKVADGDYAKHLGIIASIRRDFNQLATLMTTTQAGRKQVEGQPRSVEALESDRIPPTNSSMVFIGNTRRLPSILRKGMQTRRNTHA